MMAVTVAGGPGKAGGHYVGTISLVTNRTHLQQLLTLRPFGLRSGTLVLRSLTSGPLVQIDGVLVTRT